MSLLGRKTLLKILDEPVPDWLHPVVRSAGKLMRDGAKFTETEPIAPREAQQVYARRARGLIQEGWLLQGSEESHEELAQVVGPVRVLVVSDEDLGKQVVVVFVLDCSAIPVAGMLGCKGVRV